MHHSSSYKPLWDAERRALLGMLQSRGNSGRPDPFHDYVRLNTSIIRWGPLRSESRHRVTRILEEDLLDIGVVELWARAAVDGPRRGRAAGDRRAQDQPPGATSKSVSEGNTRTSSLATAASLVLLRRFVRILAGHKCIVANSDEFFDNLNRPDVPTVEEPDSSSLDHPRIVPPPPVSPPGKAAKVYDSHSRYSRSHFLIPAACGPQQRRGQ